MRRVGAVAAGPVVALLLVAGCSGGEGGASPPERPREVRIDGVEPCSLLTAAQRAELGLDGTPSSDTAPSVLFGGDEVACVIRGSAVPAVSVGVGVVTTAGIELFTEGQLAATVTPTRVRDFPAVVAVPDRFTDFCSVLVDVAPGQLLDVQFANGGDRPPIPQEQLCQRAGLVADASMRTLLDR